jgi:FtsZ-binding cell division protein ZapB
MTELQKQFEKWFDEYSDKNDIRLAINYGAYEIAGDAWEHQQQRIDELEEHLRCRQEAVDIQYNRAEELERVNKQIRSAFQAYYEAVKQRALSYDVEIKLIKALKQIEVK